MKDKKVLITGLIILMVIVVFLFYVSTMISIHKEAKKGNLLIIKLILLFNPDKINEKEQSDWQWTPLHIASMSGNTNVVEYLISKGAELNNIENPDKETPLHLTDNIYIAKILIDNGSDISKQNSVKDTPLLTASAFGRKEIVKLLISKGAIVNHKNKVGYTALHRASNSDVSKILIDSGSNINARTFLNKDTPLHFAAREGNVRKIRVLINNSAIVNVKDKNGNNPIHKLVSGNIFSIEELKRRGESFKSKCKDLNNSLELLLKEGADINFLNKNGASPLHFAAKYGKWIGIINTLISHGAEIEIKSKDESGGTPLHFASRDGRVEAVKILIDLGANFNSLDYSGETPIGYATEQYRFDNSPVVELLINRGADINIKNKWGFYPLYTASSLGNKKMVSIFLSNGANMESINQALKEAVRMNGRLGSRKEVIDMLKTAIKYIKK